MEHTDLVKKKIDNIKRMTGLYEIDLFKTENIKFIDLSLTSRCNLKCVFCRRQLFDENIPNIDLDLDILKSKIFTREQTKNYDKVIICGNFGDPMMYPNIDEFLEHITDVGRHLWLQINTNGTMKKTKWWANLGKMFKGLDFGIQFAIDGLEDTHSKYRVGSDYNTVMKHMEAYVENGGKAVWQFLLFSYNEHQIPEAQKICDRMGIKLQPMISYKYESRKSQPQGFNKPKNLKTQSHGNQSIQLDAAKEIYTASQTPGSQVQEIGQKAFRKPKNWKMKYTSVLSCIAAEEKGVYITESGILVPCCFTHPKNGKRYFSDVQKMHIESDIDKLDLNKSTMEKAINTDFFKNTIINRGTLSLCTFFCGRKQRFMTESTPNKNYGRLGQ